MPDGILTISAKTRIESAFTGTSETSNAERIMTLKGGLKLFLAHPVFGAGLGAFVFDYFKESGRVQVIHSTPLWLLAELGVVGAVVMMLPMLAGLPPGMAAAPRGQRCRVRAHSRHSRLWRYVERARAHVSAHVLAASLSKHGDGGRGNAPE